MMNDETISLRPGMHIHLIGIGGAGISAIARVLLVLSCPDRMQREIR